ncbi:uncharacterized protein LY79DRAFT_411091 [Colletotrichum navitas]|uniref:Uncharacterized protein n=1 Tax=Colletotrichum navitas TaxID=681940 RepID=A0AAD8PNP6_9PEZI|nr:uncharacterized protein LY79DRAFT_411091 [Colletotrichum navitas]KAK1573496.1 hypothetical protein LY79DRAFT_411091 [Colletotrichum navitas]
MSVGLKLILPIITLIIQNSSRSIPSIRSVMFAHGFCRLDKVTLGCLCCSDGGGRLTMVGRDGCSTERAGIFQASTRVQAQLDS